jgi:Neuraminidase (sialidase)
MRFRRRWPTCLFIGVLHGLLIASMLGLAIAQTEPLAAHPSLKIERHLKLEATPGNRRNSEGDFIQLKDGRWLIVYTHFTDGAKDHSKAFLASRESSDGGKTWSGKDRVIVANEGGFNVMSVSLVRLTSDEIGLFYLRKNSLQDCRPVLRRSQDEGKTWSDPQECITDEIGYYVLNNSRVIRLASGRLLMPTALHQFDGKRLQPGRVVVYLSDDTGKTWRRCRMILDRDAAGTEINFMEPGVVEAPTGRLLMVIRTKLGSQYLSESTDHGETWSMPRPGPLLSPDAPASIVRIPNTDDLLAVWNDHEGQPESYRRHQPPIRTPLAVAISHDGGATWVNHKLIEKQPVHTYCYTAIAFAGDRVLLGYSATPAPAGLETLQVSSFALKDLYQ